MWGYKWAKVESGVTFEIASSSGTIKAVTYSHTAPFATEFTACVQEGEKPKAITDFKRAMIFFAL